jgi:hypothetical protein
MYTVILYNDIVTKFSVCLSFPPFELRHLFFQKKSPGSMYLKENNVCFSQCNFNGCVLFLMRNILVFVMCKTSHVSPREDIALEARNL